MEKEYAVVEFIDSGEISTVPMVWLVMEEGKLRCHWPDKSVSLHMRTPAAPTKRWKTHAVEVIKSSMTYKRAALYEEKLKRNISHWEREGERRRSQISEEVFGMDDADGESGTSTVEERKAFQRDCSPSEIMKVMAEIVKITRETNELVKSLYPHKPIEESEEIRALPLKDEQELEQFIFRLSDHEEDYVRRLSGFGGSSLRECVKLILDKLLSHELQLICNMRGKSGTSNKIGLRGPFLNLVARAIRSGRFPHASDTEIARTIGKYLRGSRDRFGGRRRRDKRFKIRDTDIKVSMSDSESLVIAMTE